MNWNNYYAEQGGGGFDYNVYRGAAYQRGYGLGGTFKSFLNGLCRFLTNMHYP